MDKKKLGEKIQIARQREGFTQENVERELNLPQKSMTRMESGQRFPSTLELVKLAKLFHMSVEDLLSSSPVEEDPMIILHRVSPGLEQDPIIREEVRRCVNLCKEGVSLERLLEQPSRQHVLFSPRRNPSNALEACRQGELAAKEERKRLGVSNLPIHDIEELFTSQGIWCAAVHLPSEMSGLFLCHPSIGGMVTLINSTHSITRQRFSYAHEYAHALFDRDEQVLTSDALNSADLIEKRANAFAAAFLLPEEGVTETLDFLNKGKPARSSFSIFDVATEGVIEAEKRQTAKNQKISFVDVAYLARRFGVSYQAAVYRLHTLRYLSQKEREALLEGENKGKSYLRLLESDDPEPAEKTLDSRHELRIYICHLVIEAYRQEKISRGRVIELSKSLKVPFQKLLQLASSDE